MEEIGSMTKNFSHRKKETRNRFGCVNWKAVDGKILEDESKWGWKLRIGLAERWAAKKGKKNKDKGEVSRRRLAVLERKGKQINKRDCRSWCAFFFGNSLLRNL